MVKVRYGLLVGETLSKIAGADRKRCAGPERAARSGGAWSSVGEGEKEKKRREKREGGGGGGQSVEGHALFPNRSEREKERGSERQPTNENESDGESWGIVTGA